LTNDLDADGIADAQEIQLYGTTTRYAGTRLVPSTAYPAISDALALALAGELVVVSNAAYTESAVVSNGVTLTGTNLTGNATNWTMSGAVEVLSGGTVLISGGQTTFANLAIDAGGILVVSNATVTVNGVTRSGTFTLSNGWQVVTPRAVSFTETFDGFGAGTMVGALGQWGLSASAPSVQIQSGGMIGTGVLCPLAENATNQVSAGVGARLWTDLYVRDTNTVADVSLLPVNPNQTVKLCVGTNGYVMLYSGGGWLTCSNDVAGDNVDGLWSIGWNRISIFQNYEQHIAAVFLNGRLLKQNLPFINTNTNQMRWVDIEAGVRGDTWFDTLSVTNGIPAGLAAMAPADTDHDGISDIDEINAYGSLSAYPRGSVFKIR
jgi:3D (Asp-Asp-Asp) domain-containing protein